MKRLEYKNGRDEGPGMTAGELLDFLRGVPRETVIAGAWEGIRVPLRAARLVTDDKRISSHFVELDVDKYGSW